METFLLRSFDCSVFVTMLWLYSIWLCPSYISLPLQFCHCFEYTAVILWSSFDPIARNCTVWLYPITNTPSKVPIFSCFGRPTCKIPSQKFDWWNPWGDFSYFYVSAHLNPHLYSRFYPDPFRYIGNITDL